MIKSETRVEMEKESKDEKLGKGFAGELGVRGESAEGSGGKRFGTFLPRLKSNIRTARRNLGVSSPSTI